MAMDAFDLAERFQTLVFVMSDLDLGMNNWMSDDVRVSGPADRSRQGARRAEMLQKLGDVGPLQGRRRRRHPVPHRSRATACRRIFTRGSGPQREGGSYSERPDDYVNNMDRLARKFETARTLSRAGRM